LIDRPRRGIDPGEVVGRRRVVEVVVSGVVGPVVAAAEDEIATAEMRC
jgi:hypothetical protein